MKKLLSLRLCAGLAIGLLMLLTIVTGSGSIDNQPFQFSDDFYRQNGIDPDAIVDKLDCGDPRTACDESSPDPSTYSAVRIRETTGGSKHNGNLLYYWIPGKAMPNSFTNDQAGQDARQLADDSFAFLFPRLAGNPISPAFPNRRQDNIFDTRNGYFSNNPLGLWTIAFISWDGPNLTGDDCQDEMEDMAEDNGIDLDGTPIISTVSEIDKLLSEGCVIQRTRAKDGSQGFPWVI